MTTSPGEEPRAPRWRWGTRRFWIDETLNATLALSPRHVAAMGHSNVFVWRREDGSLLRAFPGFRRLADAWFDDDRALLLLRSGDGRVTVADLTSGDLPDRGPLPDDPPLPPVVVDRAGYQLRIDWPGHPSALLRYPDQSLGSPSISLASGRIAVPHDHTVDILDRDGGLIRSFPGFGQAALAPDGRSVALGDLALGRVFLADVESGALLHPEDPVGKVQQLAFSPDGGRLLVTAGGEAWILDGSDMTTTGRLVGCPSPRSSFRSAIDAWLRWTPDGGRLVGSAGHRIVVWDASSGAVTRSIDQDPCLRIEAFSSDTAGSRAATLSFLYPGGLMFVPPEHAVVWDLDRAVELAKIPVKDINGWVQLSPDGTTLALGGEDAVRLVPLPERPGEPPGPEATVASGRWTDFVRDGLQVRWGDDVLRVRRIRAGVAEEERTFPWATSFAATPDQRIFAVGFGNGRVEVYAADFSEQAQLQASGGVEALALSPDGAVVAAGGWDATVEGFLLPPRSG